MFKIQINCFIRNSLNRNFSSSVLKRSKIQYQPVIRKIDDLNKDQDKKSGDDLLRCKLASVYRLVDLKGWSESIYNHITIRSHENPDHFLINPYGLLYSEITASSLIKIDSNSNVIEKGSTSYGFNKAGFTLHSAIHDARHEINAVLHLHTPVAAGLSTLRCGLLPISQEAIICGKVAYHDYEGILVDEPMRKQIVKDLGLSKILILRNHGAAFCGSSIEECWFWVETFMTAAEIQLNALSASNGKIKENIIVPPERVVTQVQNVLKTGVNEKPADGINWKIGEMEFEAEMRRLDSLGFNTGYNYKK